MLTVELLALAAAAFTAGAVNSVAGGGTLLTFPTLVFLGVNPVAASATSTVALWPGTLGSIWGYRREVMRLDQLILVLALPSLVGGAVGAWLLLTIPASIFEAIVPYLVLFATVLFAVQSPIARRIAEHRGTDARTRNWWIAAVVLQTPVAIYGGYFGAGIGILMLAWLGMLGLDDVNAMNGIKVVLGMLINAVAVAIFAASGIVVWSAAVVMAAAAILGGWAGASAARRVGQKRLRVFIVVVGLAVTAALLLDRD